MLSCTNASVMYGVPNRIRVTRVAEVLAEGSSIISLDLTWRDNSSMGESLQNFLYFRVPRAGIKTQAGMSFHSNTVQLLVLIRPE